MKYGYRAAIPVLLIAALAACDRDNASETALAPGAPLPASEPLTTESTIAPAPPSGNVEVATAPQTPAENPGAATAPQTPAAMSTTPDNAPRASTGTVASASAEHTKAMDQLQAAAQRLREATQEMAKQPAGERRNQAIRQTNEALLETQQAMMRLPPELRTKGGAFGKTASAETSTGTAEAQDFVGTTSSASAAGLSGGTSAARYDAADARVMDKLLGAAHQLREALQAMAQQPGNAQRDQAMREARQALYDTQQAMIRVPAAPPGRKQ